MIYFYGGAFNPLTKAHLNIISDILNKMVKDDRFIIAITTHDYKRYQFSYDIRKKIIEENLRDFDLKDKNVKIINQTERTWKFLNSLTKEKITIILGEDEYNDLKKGLWHYSQEILNTYEFIIYPRIDNISSSMVREMINTDIRNSEILNYISLTTLEILKNLNK